MRDDHLRTPLFRAVERGFADMCSALLSFGADVNAKDGDGRSPLHWASILGFVSVLSVLIANRADHNTTDKTGRTPLHGASYYARDVAVKYLVEIGAEINASDFNGVTALHWAAGLGHVTTIQLLAQLGAKLNSLDNHSDYRLTPLDYALISGHHECIDLIHELGGFTGREVLELSVLTIQRVWRGYTIRRLNPSEDRKVGRKVAKQVQIVSSISPFSLNTSPIVINASYHIETGLDLDSEFFLDPNDLHWLQPGGGVS
ncbi:ankyrin repeat-containing domain protein [Cladochytrium replicatum]|nr:ankyrin repeat-containing domain protein [Cladochytrium replicatum]